MRNLLPYRVVQPAWALLNSYLRLGLFLENLLEPGASPSGGEGSPFARQPCSRPAGPALRVWALPAEITVDGGVESQARPEACWSWWFCLLPLRPSSWWLLLLARETRSTKTPWLVICEDLVVKRDAFVAVSALDEVGLTGEQGVPRMVRG